MLRWNGRVAMVTGASSGIGAAICKKLVAAGMVVVGAARGFERIEALSKQLKTEGHPGSLVPFKCDLTVNADIENLFTFIKKEYEGVDVCINNAGIAHINNNLLNGNPDEWMKTMQVNILSLCLCTKESVKSMRERQVDDGHIINIGSTCGHQVTGGPGLHFYCATKHAVRALTEGVRQELRDLNSNIRISVISPSWVETEIVARSSQGKAPSDFFKTIPCTQPEDVADTVCHVLGAPPHVQIQDVIIRPTRDTQV